MRRQSLIDSENCGNEVDGMCDRAEAIQWLQRRMDEWKSEESEG